MRGRACPGRSATCCRPRRASRCSSSTPKGSSRCPAARGRASASSTRTVPRGLRVRSPARSTSSCSVRTSAATPAATRGCRSSRRRCASRRSRPATCTRTTCAGRGCRTRSSRSGTARRSTAASASGAGTTSRVLLSPAEMLERLPRDAALRTREIADRCVFDLTQELGYRYPDFSDGVDPADVQLRAICEPRVRRALRGRERAQAARARAARRRARAHRAARSRRVLPAPLGGARARARVRARGARPGQPAPRAAAGPRARVERRLDRLLPDGPLARRPVEAGLSLGRFINDEMVAVPDIDLDFPRDIREKLIVRVTERYGRERAALVATLRDLPQPRRDPRRRQGARAAVRRSSSGSRASPTAGTRRASARSSTACRAGTPARAGKRSAR